MKFFADSGMRGLARKLSPRADVSAVFFVHDETRQRAGKGPEEELHLIVRVLVWQEAHHHGGCQVVELLNFGAAPDGGRSVLRLRASGNNTEQSWKCASLPVALRANSESPEKKMAEFS